MARIGSERASRHDVALDCGKAMTDDDLNPTRPTPHGPPPRLTQTPDRRHVDPAQRIPAKELADKVEEFLKKLDELDPLLILTPKIGPVRPGYTRVVPAGERSDADESEGEP